MVQGLRYVFLPDWVAVDDYGGEWQVERGAAGAGLWLTVRLRFARVFFRWNRGYSG